MKCSPRGVPLLSDLFDQANKIATFNVLTFINADIILPDNFLDPIPNIESNFNKFMIVGHRWDMDVTDDINFNDPIEKRRFWSKVEIESQKP